MARHKRTSPVVEKAYLRAVSLKSIDSALDLNGGMTLAAYEAEISAVRATLDLYNTKLSELDGILNGLQAQEKALNISSSRMLAAVGVAYGKDSSEYEQAGGTRTSERARNKTTTAAP